MLMILIRAHNQAVIIMARKPTPTFLVSLSGTVQEQAASKVGGRAPHQGWKEERMEEAPVCAQSFWSLLLQGWKVSGEATHSVG